MNSAVTLATTSTETCSLIANLLHLLCITTDNVMFFNLALSGGDSTQHHLLLMIPITRILTHIVIM